MICCSRLASVNIDFGRRGSKRIMKSTFFDFGDVLEGARDIAVQIVQPQFAGFHHHRARFDLRQIEDVVDEHQQIVAGAVDGLGEFGLLRRQVAFGVFGQLVGKNQQAVERRAQFVRHVGQEFGFVFGGRASCLALSSSSWRACSTSLFLRSTS